MSSVYFLIRFGHIYFFKGLLEFFSDLKHLLTGSVSINTEIDPIVLLQHNQDGNLILPTSNNYIPLFSDYNRRVGKMFLKNESNSRNWDEEYPHSNIGSNGSSDFDFGNSIFDHNRKHAGFGYLGSRREAMSHDIGLGINDAQLVSGFYGSFGESISGINDARQGPGFYGSLGEAMSQGASIGPTDGGPGFYI